ncbi:MAG: hypothetical protein H7249_02400 [Chitinophagaceae bacterium]|nr:hypothetical protein [Oligoflexus sp.]
MNHRFHSKDNSLNKNLLRAELDELCVNSIRFLAVDAVQKAGSGHPGLPLGAASMSYVLWDHFLKFNPTDPKWIDWDRFVLSAGHGSAMLYALLHLSGFDLTLDDLKEFRQWQSRTPGHPEYGKVPGVEATTGPLGQGFGNAVGMAIAEQTLASRFNRHQVRSAPRNGSPKNPGKRGPWGARRESSKLEFV